MKNLLLLFLFAIPLFSFGQPSIQSRLDSVNAEYVKYIKEYEGYKQPNAKIDSGIKCVKELSYAYEDIGELDDITNNSVVEYMLSDFYSKCSGVFDSHFEEENFVMRFDASMPFKNKAVFDYFIKLQESKTKLIVTGKIMDFMITEDRKNNKVLNDFVSKNLIRIKMSRADFEKLSDNDRNILFKTFK